jgi:hypothetical protein
MEGGRDRERQRETERETDRDRQRQRERERERVRERERERGDKEREREERGGGGATCSQVTLRMRKAPQMASEHRGAANSSTLTPHGQHHAAHSRPRCATATLATPTAALAACALCIGTAAVWMQPEVDVAVGRRRRGRQDGGED